MAPGAAHQFPPQGAVEIVDDSHSLESTALFPFVLIGKAAQVTCVRVMRTNHTALEDRLRRDHWRGRFHVLAIDALRVQ